MVQENVLFTEGLNKFYYLNYEINKITGGETNE